MPIATHSSPSLSLSALERPLLTSATMAASPEQFGGAVPPPSAHLVWSPAVFPPDYGELLFSAPSLPVPFLDYAGHSTSSYGGSVRLGKLIQAC